MNLYDVIIVGFGPTGKVLARQLVDRGHRVAIVDRWPAAYPLPRAVGFDHEIKRMFHALGVAREVERISRPVRHYVWYNAEWEVLIDMDYGQESASGGSIGYLFNQPELERILESSLAGCDNLDILTGYEALAVRDVGEFCELDIAPYDQERKQARNDETRTLRGRYLVGCDGANSLVRRAIGSAIFNHGFDAEWLVVDVKPHDLAHLPVPDAAQWCNPARPVTIVPSGVDTRRWEFMLLDGETPTEMAEEAKVWELLAPWLKPEDATLIRRAVYRFRSHLARQWRKGRLLIAGDAAHLMPPFMGQGMCSGLRDACTLGWRLDYVLRGLVPEATLNDYERERSPHVDGLIRLSMQMGRIVCVSDPAAARQRDAAFFSGQVPPPPPFPGITGGAVRRRPDGLLDRGAGALLPHVSLDVDGVPRRLDDLTGRNFVLLVAADRGAVELGGFEQALVEEIGGCIVKVGPGGYRDLDGRLDALFAQTGACAVLARPDFYAFGFAYTPQDIPALVRDATAQLKNRNADVSACAAE